MYNGEPDAVTYDCYGRTYHFKGKEMRSVTTVLKMMEGARIWLRKAKVRHEKRNPHYPWKQYTDDAMLVGTYLHYWIGVDLLERSKSNMPRPEFEPTRPIPDTDYTDVRGRHRNRIDDYEMMIAFWKDFARIANPIILGTGLERFVWHSTGYAGRVDCVLKFDWDFERMIRFRDRFVFDEENGRPRGDLTWLVDLKSSKAVYEDYPAQVWAYKLAWNERVPRYQVERTAVLQMNGETGWEFVEVTGRTPCKINIDGHIQHIPAVAYWNRAMGEAKRQGLIIIN